MLEFVDRLSREGATRQHARKISRKDKAKASRGRPRHFVYRYEPREKSFRLSLQFKKGDVPREEIIQALRAILDELSREGG